MKTTAFILGIALTFGLTSCERNTKQLGEKGNMIIKMTDAPADYKSLYVEIKGVEVYSEEEGWASLSTESQMIDVLTLTNGTTAELAFSQDVDAGFYTKLKLVFGTENTLGVNAGSEGNASSETTINYDVDLIEDQEVIIEISEQVSTNATAEILIDFNVAQSIIAFGEEYILDPVITVVSDTSTGIAGQFEAGVSGYVMVINGEDTLSAYVDANGSFEILGVMDGLREVIVVPSQEDIFPTNGQLIEMVLVTEGSITQMGEIKF